MASFFSRIQRFLKRDDEEEKKRRQQPQTSFGDKLGRGLLEVGAAIQRKIPEPIRTPENVRKAPSLFKRTVDEGLGGERTSFRDKLTRGVLEAGAAIQRRVPKSIRETGEEEVLLPAAKAKLAFQKGNIKEGAKEFGKAFLGGANAPFSAFTREAKTRSKKEISKRFGSEAGEKYGDIAGELIGVLPALLSVNGKVDAVMKAPKIVGILNRAGKAKPILEKAIKEGLEFAYASGVSKPGSIEEKIKAAKEGFVVGVPFGAGAGVSGSLFKKAASVLQIPGTTKFLQLSEQQFKKLQNEPANKFIYHLSAGATKKNLLKEGTELTMGQLKKEYPKVFNLVKKATPSFTERLKSARIDTGTLVKRGAVMAGTAGALEAGRQQLEEGKVKPGEAAFAGAATLPFALFGGLKVVGGKKLAGAALKKAEIAAGTVKKNLETKFQIAVDSGSEKEVKRLLGQFKVFDTQAEKFGVTARIRPETELRAEVEKATQEAQAELAPKSFTEGLRDKFGAEAETVRKHIQTIKLMGEKTSKKAGELFREHIPRTKGASASDEVASALGMTESEYMQEVVQRAGVVGGGATEARSPFFKSLRRQAQAKVEKMPVLRKTPLKVAEGQEILPGTVRPADLNATTSQIKDVRILRKRAGVTDEQGKILLKNLFGKESYTKLNRQEAEIIKSYLQPKAKARLKPLLTEAKEKISLERLSKARQFAVQTSTSPLEQKYGAVGGIKSIEKDIDNLVADVKSLPPVEKKKSSFFSTLAKVPREQSGAKIAGIKDEFFNSVTSLLNTTTILSNRLKDGIKSTFQGLNKEEQKRVLFNASGVDVGKLSEKEAQSVKYLREIFDAHLNLANRVRTLAGKKPIPKRKNYIPFIISEDLAEAFGTGRTEKFFLERTKTNQELLAGLFSQNPEHIAEIFSRSAGRFFKRDLYQGVLRERANQVRGISSSASAFVREIEQKDIGVLPDISSDFGRITLQRLNESVAKVSGKRIPITPELKKALENTHFADDLQEQLKKGYIELPRFKLEGAAGEARGLVYLAKLGLNPLFTLINLTQRSLELPFVSLKNFALASVDVLRVLSPLRSDKDKRFMKFLKESSVFSDVGGEDVKIRAVINNTIGFNIKISEFLNRTGSAFAGLRQATSAAKKTGQELSEQDSFRIASEFAKFVNPIQGAGRAPLHARGGVLSSVLYMFKQFPLQAADVYHEAFKAGIKDKGVAKFWQSMSRASGASPEATKLFEALPPESKAKALKLMATAIIPVSVIYGLTGSWTIASRLLPQKSAVPDLGNPLIDLSLSFIKFMEDPERNSEDFKKQLVKTFEPVQFKRIVDAVELAQKGRIEDTRGRVQYTLKEGQSALKVGLFGRGTITEDDKFKRVRELEKEDKKASEEGYKTAKQILTDIREAGSVEEKKAVLQGYYDKSLITESVVDKMKTLLKEEATGKGTLERSVQGLSPTARAQYVIDEINAAKSVEEKRKILQTMYSQGIITKAVIKEMKTLLQQPKKKKSFIDNLRSLPVIP